MKIEVKIPDLGSSESLTITYWHSNEGDIVKEGNDLVEVATEKATFNVAVPSTGKLIQKKFQEGEIVKTGDVVAVIEKSEVTK